VHRALVRFGPNADQGSWLGGAGREPWLPVNSTVSYPAGTVADTWKRVSGADRSERQSNSMKLNESLRVGIWREGEGTGSQRHTSPPCPPLPSEISKLTQCSPGAPPPITIASKPFIAAALRRIVHAPCTPHTSQASWRRLVLSLLRAARERPRPGAMPVPGRQTTDTPCHQQRVREDDS